MLKEEHKKIKLCLYLQITQAKILKQGQNKVHLQNEPKESNKVKIKGLHLIKLRPPNVWTCPIKAHISVQLELTKDDFFMLPCIVEMYF